MKIEFDDYYREGVDYSTMSEQELQLRLLFSVIVAGKNAKFAKNVLRNMFAKYADDILPFQLIRKWVKNGSLEKHIRSSRSGNYGKMLNCFPLLININPRNASLEDLEKIPGIGPKTSRFYHLWIGKKTVCAAIDVHFLKFLRDLGYKNIPKSTPSGRRYMELEQAILKEATKRNLTPNQLDADVWMAYSTKNQEKIQLLLN